MKIIKPAFLVIALFSSLCVNAQELKLPKIFGDSMVLQREAPVRFWGWGKPGGDIMVSIDEFTVKSRVDNEGRWECLYPAHEAGGPHTVVIFGDAQITYSDVYFGDVWVAGGQSNMEWKVSDHIDNMEAEIADSNYPQIRQIKVPKGKSPVPVDDITGGAWSAANPDNVGDFSAVAWFFAKKNHMEKGVPVGIINSNWGGTPAEAWTSAETLMGVEGYKEEAGEVLDPAIDWPKKLANNDSLTKAKWDMIWDKEGSIATGIQKADFDDSDWTEVSLPNSEPLSDFAWFRKTFELKNTKKVKLSFGMLTQLVTIYVNGVEIWDRKWQPLEVFELSPEYLVKGTNTIAFRAVNDWDNRVYLGKEGAMWVQEGKKKTSLEGPWKYSNTVEAKMPEDYRYEWKSSFLFNQMIYPIAGYSIKGAVWYQGEGNAGRPQYYRELFGQMIRDWREYWKQGSFPFLYVQLANWQARKEQPSESNWAALQEAQTQTLELPNTGMATIIDIGDAEDIHPRNKQDVGKRLWLAARKVAFGEDLVYSGPMYKSHSVEGSKVTIQYELFGSSLEIKGEELVGFAVAGEDKKFYWAQGTIEGDAIVISSDQVANPAYIRYAWADNPACNVYNKEGLPAVPFRTDK